MKRICLFAGFDKDNIIHDYVVYYLKELSTVADVYYMADNEINDEEKNKITPYVKEAYGFHHSKYDFGSWQELIKIIGWDKLSEYNELVLANDSVFGPLYPMVDFFNIIEQDKEWDVCGYTGGKLEKAKHPHIVSKDIDGLASFFLVFKKNAFISNIFKNYICSEIKINNYKDVVLQYEITLAYQFYSAGFNVKAYLYNINPYEDWYKVINKNRYSLFIKKKIFVSGKKMAAECKAFLYKLFFKYNNFYNYDVTLIDDYIKKNNVSLGKLFMYAFTSRIFLKSIRQWLIQINIKKNRKIIRLFGFYLLNYNKITPISQDKIGIIK